ncbi:hypothetical protein V6N13_001082 [Hibiscus sabdariffa]
MDAGAVEGVGLNGGTKMSYAFMAAKSYDTNGSPMKDLNFTDEELLIVDDILVVEWLVKVRVSWKGKLRAHGNGLDEGADLVHNMETIQETEVLPTNVDISSVSVVDKSNAHKAVARTREGFSLSNQHTKENRGLQIKKGSKTHFSNRVVLSECLRSTAYMIDFEARRMQHGLERDHDAMDDDDPDGYNLEVVDVIYDSQHHVDAMLGGSHKGDMPSQ